MLDKIIPDAGTLDMSICAHRSTDAKTNQKSRIRKTNHLLTDADSSPNTTVGWIKNTQKPNFFEKLKNHPKHKNSKTSRDMPKLAYALRPEVSNPLGSVVSTMFCKTKSAKKNFFLRSDFKPLPNKNVQM